ncbi:MAG: AtpZ/AtpI family protein, partial [Acidimicrobiales bacterium]
MDLRERRELYNGFGDTLTRAVELVAVPGVFALAGHLLDRALGTSPLLAVALAVFALAGVFVRAYFAYEVAMRAHEAQRPWA